MHANPDLRVVLNWMINRSGSAISDVIPLESNSNMFNTTAPEFPLHVELEGRRVSTVVLPSFSGSQCRNGPYGAISSPKSSSGETHATCDTALPGDHFIEAVQWIISHEQDIRDVMLESLIDHYKEMREVEIEYLEDANPDVVLPVIQKSADLLPLCGLVAVHIDKLMDTGEPRYGIELGCNWDSDNGAGVRLTGLKVEAAGESDHSFMF